MSTGVVLNDEMNDFSFENVTSYRDGIPLPPANFIEPGKRPLSSMVTFSRKFPHDFVHSLQVLY